MYYFKKDKYMEMLDGRTVEWLARQIGYNNMTLYAIFNGRRGCKRGLALGIVKTLNDDYRVDDYFYEIDNKEGN